jgi:hypothetical protein
MLNPLRKMLCVTRRTGRRQRASHRVGPTLSPLPADTAPSKFDLAALRRTHPAAPLRAPSNAAAAPPSSATAVPHAAPRQGPSPRRRGPHPPPTALLRPVRSNLCPVRCKLRPIPTSLEATSPRPLAPDGGAAPPSQSFSP